MFAGLQQLNVGSQILARLNGSGFPQNQIAVGQPVECRFLPGIFTVAQPFLVVFYGTGNFLLKEGLAVVFVNKTDLHLRRKLIIHDGAVHFFKIFGHIRSPFAEVQGFKGSEVLGSRV